MKFHVVPMVPDKPNKIRFCSENFCKPCDYIHHPFQSSPYISGIPIQHRRPRYNSAAAQSIKSYLGIGGNPVGSFGIIVTLFDPFTEKGAANRLVPIVTASKAERVPTTTSYRTRFYMLYSNNTAAIRTWAPS